MNHFPPFEMIRRAVDIPTTRGEPRVSMSHEDVIGLLRLIPGGVQVDEERRARVHDDIGQAIRSARRRFADDGRSGERPFSIRVDEAWHLKRCPDVAEDAREGLLVPSREHLDPDGHKEGRLPLEM